MKNYGKEDFIMYDYQINRERLLRHLQELGNMGRRNDGELSRLVASDVDKLGRDLVVKWMKELGLDIKIDRIGNVFGVWSTEENQNKKPVFIGSHIDSVIDRKSTRLNSSHANI